MASSQETKDKPHPYERKPKPDLTRPIGSIAIKGPAKGKNGK